MERQFCSIGQRRSGGDDETQQEGRSSFKVRRSLAYFLRFRAIEGNIGIAFPAADTLLDSLASRHDAIRRHPGTPDLSSKTIEEPARHVPVYGEYDVAVLGGGPAGIAAAVAARAPGGGRC